MNRTTNLKPFPPGRSGNPNGRPKGAKDGPVACLRRLLQKEASAEGRVWLEEQGIRLTKDTTNADVIAHVIILLGCRGDLAAMRLALEWTEPRPTQSIRGLGNEPLVFTVNPMPLPEEVDSERGADA